jgi:hypothetical protein
LLVVYCNRLLFRASCRVVQGLVGSGETKTFWTERTNFPLAMLALRGAGALLRRASEAAASSWCATGTLPVGRLNRLSSARMPGSVLVACRPKTTTATATATDAAAARAAARVEGASAAGQPRQDAARALGGEGGQQQEQHASRSRSRDRGPKKEARERRRKYDTATAEHKFTLQQKMEVQKKLSVELSREMVGLLMAEDPKFFDAVVNGSWHLRFEDYGILTGFAVRGHQWRAVLLLFGHLKAKGFRPSALMYRSVINVHGRLGNWQKALEQLETARAAKGLAANTRDYPSIFHEAMIACVQNEQPYKALDVLEKLVLDGVHKTADCSLLFHTAIFRCVDNEYSAKWLVALLVRAGVKLDAVTGDAKAAYSRLVHFHKKLNDVMYLCSDAGVAEFLSNAGALTTEDRSSFFIAGMRGLGHHGHVADVVEVMKAMKAA